MYEIELDDGQILHVRRLGPILKEEEHRVWIMADSIPVVIGKESLAVMWRLDCEQSAKETSYAER